MNIVFSKKDNSAKFFGEGTFDAKEDIKNLGNARWLSAEKTWQVMDLSISIEELETLFPNADFSNEDELALDEDKEAPSQSGKKEVPILEVFKKERKEYSVSDLSNSLRKALKAAFPVPVLVFGVINKVNSSGKGTFVELSDTQQRENFVSCSVWGSADKIFKPLTDAGFKVEKDLEVMFEVAINFSAKGGRLFLTINKVVADYTVQKLAAQREVTNQRLKKEGLFDKNKQLNLPLLPRRLAVLTSKTGTVINDFMDSLSSSEFGFEVSWHSVLVQGDSAKKEVVDGLSYFSANKDKYDAILLFRGGGSPAELAIFNNYEIAKAICNSELPVICAIGHQEDECSSQDVAFHSLGVPKDIGRYFSDIITSLRSNFISYLTGIESEANSHYQKKSKDLSLSLMEISSTSKDLLSSGRENFIRSLSTLPIKCSSTLTYFNQSLLKSLSSIITGSKASNLDNQHRFLRQISVTTSTLKSNFNTSKLTAAASRVVSVIEQNYSQQKFQIDVLENKVKDLDPKVQLKRGFALVKDSKGNYIKEVNTAKQNNQLELILSDGSIDVKTIKK